MYRRTDVGTMDSFRRGLESKTNILVPSFFLGRDFLTNFTPSHKFLLLFHGTKISYRGLWRFGIGAASGTPFRSTNDGKLRNNKGSGKQQYALGQPWWMCS